MTALTLAQASTIVDNRCAMMRVVRSAEISARLAWISRSVLVSSAEVASSKTRSFGAFRITLAIATRCFSPPDNLRPRSPTIV